MKNSEIVLNYKVFGEGEPVVILHGLFGTLDNWQTFAKKLAEHYMVYIVDQRNHGKSPHTDTHSYELAAEDIRAFLEDEGIHKTRLIGHSMGGKTVMQFAVDNEDMIEQMVVVDIAPKAYAPGHNEIFEALHAVDIDHVSSRQEVDEVLAKYIHESGVRLFLMKNLKRKKQGGFEWKMNLSVLYDFYENIITDIPQEYKVEVETLFVRGGASDYILDSDVETINEKYANATVCTVDGAGHWIHAEKPKELLDLVTSFFGNRLNKF